MRKSQRNIVLKAAGGAFAVMLIIGAGVFFFREKMEGLRDRIGQLSAVIEEYDRQTVTVLCASRDIMPGERLQPEDYIAMDIAADAAPGDRIIEADHLSGKILKIGIKENTYITNGMLVNELPDNDERELTYDCVRVDPAVRIGACVDIRIRYPDSTDYIVLTKKTVYGTDGSALILHVGEEELLLMDSAVVDAFLFEGSYLYTVVYLEDSLQEAATANYTPNIQTIDLIRRDPNIVSVASGSLNEDIRQDIERRLTSNEGD